MLVFPASRPDRAGKLGNQWENDHANFCDVLREDAANYPKMHAAQQVRRWPPLWPAASQLGGFFCGINRHLEMHAC
jgi:hypothetical protein